MINLVIMQRRSLGGSRPVTPIGQKLVLPPNPSPPANPMS